jgi:hypothetical protein
MAGRLGIADPLFVPLTTRGADPRCESYRYGWDSWFPQVIVEVDGGGGPRDPQQQMRIDMARQ